MVKKYVKAEAVQLTDNFFSTDFDCKCHHPFCTYTLIDTDLVDSLDVLADKFGSIEITSGFRCSVHNNEVGGKPGSQHLQGKAVDIKTIFASLNELYFTAVKIENFLNGGVGVYNNFIHLDVRGYKARWGNHIEGE